MELLEVIEEAAVEFPLLMRVLAVAKASRQRKVERERCTGCAFVIKVSADGTIIRTRRGKGLHRKAGTELGGGLAIAGPHRLQHAGIVVGIDDNGHGAVVL